MYCLARDQPKSIRSFLKNPTQKHKKLQEELCAKCVCSNPTPDEVTDIVSLLKPYRDVEEKSVFYWFQNTHWSKRWKEQKISMQESSQYEKEITELSLGPPFTPSTPRKLYIVCSFFSIILTIFLTNSYFVALSVFNPNLWHYLWDFDEYSYILISSKYIIDSQFLWFGY